MTVPVPETQPAVATLMPTLTVPIRMVPVRFRGSKKCSNFTSQRLPASRRACLPNSASMPQELPISTDPIPSYVTGAAPLRSPLPQTHLCEPAPFLRWPLARRASYTGVKQNPSNNTLPNLHSWLRRFTATTGKHLGSMGTWRPQKPDCQGI